MANDAAGARAGSPAEESASPGSRLLSALPVLGRLVKKNQRLQQQVRDLLAREVGEGRLWVRPGHFYSPLTSREEVAADAARIFERSPSLLPGIDLWLAEQRELLDRCLTMRAELEQLPHEEQKDWRYYSDNAFFPFCDAFFLAALLRLFRPRRVIEIGSGFSSSVMLDVDDKFLGRSLQLTFVEPNPERLESLLRRGDARRHRIVRSRVQDVPLETFDELESGDILFIDSSHVSKTGSDVNHLFFRVVPRLRPGVLVHVHDVAWPFEYPENEVYEGRSWNEAYLVRAFLQYNREFRILLYPSLFAHHPEAGRTLPERCLRPLGPSLWLQRVPVGG